MVNFFIFISILVTAKLTHLLKLNAQIYMKKKSHLAKLRRM